jgi:hypothetical protein
MVTTTKAFPPGANAACKTFPKKARLSPSSWHRVKTSSSWSTTQSVCSSSRPDEAEALAREAVRIADSTEGTLWQADAYRALADVMAILRRPDEEGRALREALGRYEEKGMPIHVEEVRRRLRAATGATGPA